MALIRFGLIVECVKTGLAEMILTVRAVYHCQVVTAINTVDHHYLVGVVNFGDFSMKNCSLNDQEALSIELDFEVDL